MTMRDLNKAVLEWVYWNSSPCSLAYAIGKWWGNPGFRLYALRWANEGGSIMFVGHALWGDDVCWNAIMGVNQNTEDQI